MLNAATIEKLKVLILDGVDYTIVTKLKNGHYHLAPRPNQPCTGGNHRKYEASHPGECTRPGDICPTDLKNHSGICDDEYDFDDKGLPIWRFPDGKPVGAGYVMYIAPETMPLFQYVTSDVSPWIKGFGNAENIIPVKRHETDKYLDGFILSTGDIDPTIWINFLFFLRNINGKWRTFKEAVDNGLSYRDALVLATFTTEKEYWDDDGDYNNPVYPMDTYTWDTRNSVRKFITQQPDDLTGGLWSDRYDYNRPQVASVFRDPECVPFVKQINKLVSPEKSVYEAAREVIQKELGE